MSAGMLSVIFVWLVAAIGVVIMKKLQPETWILYLVWVVVVCILLTLYLYLLCEIYKIGYYLKIDEDFEYMPDDAKYFRVSVYKDYITGSAYKYQMFEKGTAKTHWQAYFNSYKSSENQVLFDKVIDTLGDSITEQRTWQGYVADALHTGVIYNHGIGGTRISGNDSNAMWQDSRINALNDDIDCLLIMGGTNDGAQGVTIGDMSRDNVNTDTFVGAYNVLLSKVFYKYYRLGSGYSGITQISEVNPIQIMIATPIYCNDSNYGNMDEIAEAVRGVANLWSIPVADQHAKSGINSATSSIYLSDNVHPNDEGGKKVANVWVNALKSNAELIN